MLIPLKTAVRKNSVIFLKMKVVYSCLSLTWIHTCISMYITNSKLSNQVPVVVTLIDDGSVHRRYKRETNPFPSQLRFQLTSQEKDIELNLKRNNLKATVPYYTQSDEFGDIIKHELESKKNIRFYTDVGQSAAIGVRCGETEQDGTCHYLLSGTLVIDGDHHVIRPRSVDNLPGHELTKTDAGDYAFGTDYVNIPENLNNPIGNKKKSLDSFPLAEGLVEEGPVVTTHYKIELLPVCDFGLYQVWYNLQDPAKTESEKYQGVVESMMEYYAHVINSMNVHYDTIRGVAWDIEIVYAGLYVANVSTASNWTDGIKEDRSEVRFWVAADTGLNRFKTWLEGATGLPDYDHAMALTGYELYRGSSSSTLGLAWVGGLCWKRWGQFYENSILEDHLTGVLAHVASHELGHNIDALHDGGTANNCSASDRYVMAPSVGASTSPQGTNHYIFSNCSVDYFQSYINYLDTNNFNCMETLSVNHDPTALDQYNDTVFNGQIYTVDEQCQYNQNKSSYLCRYFHIDDPTTVCKYIYCLIPDRPGYCSIHLPWDGTVCGDGQWCIAGQCCNDTRAIAADPTCILGDNPLCSTTITATPYLCYGSLYNGRDCCSICKNYLTGITGCEYGDRQNGCTLQNCTDSQSRDICCKTCSEDATSITADTTTDASTTLMSTTESTPTDAISASMSITTGTTTDATTTSMSTPADTTLDASTTSMSTTTGTTTEATTTSLPTPAGTTTDATTSSMSTDATTTSMTTDATTTLKSTDATTTLISTDASTISMSTQAGTTTDATSTSMSTDATTTLMSTDATTTSMYTTAGTTTDTTTTLMSTDATTTSMSTPAGTTIYATTTSMSTDATTTSMSTDDTTTSMSTDATTTSMSTPASTTTDVPTTSMSTDATTISMSTDATTTSMSTPAGTTTATTTTAMSTDATTTSMSTPAATTTDAPSKSRSTDATTISMSTDVTTTSMSTPAGTTTAATTTSMSTDATTSMSTTAGTTTDDTTTSKSTDATTTSMSPDATTTSMSTDATTTSMSTPAGTTKATTTTSMLTDATTTSTSTPAGTTKAITTTSMSTDATTTSMSTDVTTTSMSTPTGTTTDATTTSMSTDATTSSMSTTAGTTTDATIKSMSTPAGTTPDATTTSMFTTEAAMTTESTMIETTDAKTTLSTVTEQTATTETTTTTSNTNNDIPVTTIVFAVIGSVGGVVVVAFVVIYCYVAKCQTVTRVVPL